MASVRAAARGGLHPPMHPSRTLDSAFVAPRGWVKQSITGGGGSTMRQVEPAEAFQQAQGSCFASLFGRFQVSAANGREIVITNRRARTLLGMLCLARSEVLDRDFLSKLLWPGRFEAHAKASLRQCLLELLGHVLISVIPINSRVLPKALAGRASWDWFSRLTKTCLWD